MLPAGAHVPQKAGLALSPALSSRERASQSGNHDYQRSALCSCSQTTRNMAGEMGVGVGKEEEKTGREGGRREGNDRENTATLKSPWPDEKVISEPTFVGLALHFGKAGHSGSRERCGVGAPAFPPQGTAGGKGTVSHGHSGADT